MMPPGGWVPPLFPHIGDSRNFGVPLGRILRDAAPGGNAHGRPLRRVTSLPRPRACSAHVAGALLRRSTTRGRVSRVGRCSSAVGWACQHHSSVALTTPPGASRKSVRRGGPALIRCEQGGTGRGKGLKRGRTARVASEGNIRSPSASSRKITSRSCRRATILAGQRRRRVHALCGSVRRPQSCHGPRKRHQRASRGLLISSQPTPPVYSRDARTSARTMDDQLAAGREPTS